MSDLKPKQTKITLGGKEYGLLFNLNAIDAIQDKFDIPISGLTDMLQDERKAFKALKAILAILINEAIEDAENGDPLVTESFVGRKITMNDILQMKTSVFASLTDGMPDADDEDEADPNEKSGQ